MEPLSDFRSSAAAMPMMNMPMNRASFVDVFSRAGGILNHATNYLEKMVANNLIDDRTFEAIVAETERLFDLYVGPLDIPWLPNAIESRVDAQIRASIRPTLKAARDFFKGRMKVDPAPAPVTSPAPSGNAQ